MGEKRRVSWVGQRRARMERLLENWPDGDAKDTTFYQWLMTQVDRDDVVGKLARDVRDDPYVRRGDMWYDFWGGEAFGGTETPEALAAVRATMEAWEDREAAK